MIDKDDPAGDQDLLAEESLDRKKDRKKEKAKEKKKKPSDDEGGEVADETIDGDTKPVKKEAKKARESRPESRPRTRSATPEPTRLSDYAKTSGKTRKKDASAPGSPMAKTAPKRSSSFSAPERLDRALLSENEAPGARPRRRDSAENLDERFEQKLKRREFAVLEKSEKTDIPPKAETKPKRKDSIHGEQKSKKPNEKHEAEPKTDEGNLADKSLAKQPKIAEGYDTPKVEQRKRRKERAMSASVANVTGPGLDEGGSRHLEGSSKHQKKQRSKSTAGIITGRDIDAKNGVTKNSSTESAETQQKDLRKQRSRDSGEASTDEEKVDANDESKTSDDAVEGNKKELKKQRSKRKLSRKLSRAGAEEFARDVLTGKSDHGGESNGTTHAATTPETKAEMNAPAQRRDSVEKLTNKHVNNAKKPSAPDEVSLVSTDETTVSPRKQRQKPRDGGAESSDDDEDIEEKRRLWRLQKMRQRQLDGNGGRSVSTGRSRSPRKREKSEEGNGPRPRSPRRQKTPEIAPDPEPPVPAEDDDDDDKTIRRGNRPRKPKPRDESLNPVSEKETSDSEDAKQVLGKASKPAPVIVENNRLTIAPVATEPKIIKAKGKKDKKWTRYKTLTLDGIEDYIIRETQRGGYGGRLDYCEEATGFFHAKKVGKRWTLVDPEGCLFMSVGVNSVGLQDEDGIHVEAFAAEFKSTSVWAKDTHNYLFNQLGFNTLGCWSEPQAFHEEGIRLPYCPRWNFMLYYCRKRPHGRVKLADGLIPCFDPEFEAFCDERAKGLVDTSTDPWIVGHFSDNELPLKEQDIITRYLDLPETDPGHQAAANWLSERNKDREGITKADDTEFCSEVIERYFRIVSKAIKKYDPNHLFLGTRFHGLVLKQDCTFLACARWVDVVSVNYYHRWTPEQERINQWCALSGRPLLVTEWYAKGEDAPGCDNINGAGFIVPTQRNRGAFYENFAIGLLRNPNVVGWHWHRYIDKQGLNAGILDRNFKPYGPLAQSMNRINAKLYSLSDHLLAASSRLFMDEPESVF